MRALKTLVMMQLKDKIDMSFLSSWKKALFKTIMWIIKFVAITAIIIIGFSVLDSLRLLSILPGIPQNFMVVVFSIMFLLSLLVCTVGISRSLYFAKDNQVLLTLPANRTMIFSSKIVVYYIYELIRNVTYFLPVFIAYGYANQMPFYYYIWILFATAILTAVPVVLGALLSIPMMYIIGFLRQNKWLAYTLLVICAAGALGLIIWIVVSLPTNINILANWGTTFWQIQDVLNSLNKVFAPLSWLLIMVVGSRYGISNLLFEGKQFIILFSVIGIIAAVLGITYLIVRPLYFKMASSPFEYRRTKVKPKPNKKLGAGASALKKELLLLYRTPGKMFALIATVVFLPIAIFLLNKLYGAMITNMRGDFMEVMFNVLIILLVATATNAGIAQIYSEEGASAYLIKTNPQSYVKQLTMKLVINAVMVSASLLASTIIFGVFQGFEVKVIVELFLFTECVYLSHLLWSAEMDIMNPQNAQYQSTGQHVNNPNSIKSTLTSMFLSVIFAVLTFFFMSEGVQMVFVRLFIFAAIFLLIRIWLYVNKIKVYYKEKQ